LELRGLLGFSERLFDVTVAGQPVAGPAPPHNGYDPPRTTARHPHTRTAERLLAERRRGRRCTPASFVRGARAAAGL
jgi:hypothetical protein